MVYQEFGLSDDDPDGELTFQFAPSADRPLWLTYEDDDGEISLGCGLTPEKCEQFVAALEAAADRADEYEHPERSGSTQSPSGPSRLRNDITTIISAGATFLIATWAIQQIPWTNISVNGDPLGAPSLWHLVGLGMLTIVLMLVIYGYVRIGPAHVSNQWGARR